jgi:glutamine synthetase
MATLLTFDKLKNHIQKGTIDTVLTCIVDMKGRLMGKSFHAQNFIYHSVHETHC